MALRYKEYALDEAAVETISVETQDYLKRQGVERLNVQRIRLTVEELLLNIMGHRDRSEKIRVGLGKHFGRHLLRLRYEMEQPFDPTESSDSPWTDDMMRALGFSPVWSHRGRVNTVSFVLMDRPKRGTLFYITLAVLAALLLGSIGDYLPKSLLQTLDATVLKPVGEGFLGLLKTFSGLMILFTLCNGMLGMGGSDSASLGRTSRNILLHCLGMSFAISVATAVLLLPFLELKISSGAQGQSSILVQISHMLFNVLPSNIIEPFQTGNAMQIIVVSMFAGFGLLAIGERGSRLCGLVNEAATLSQHIVSSICALVPAFVFVQLLRNLWLGGDEGALLSIVKPLTLSLATLFAVTSVILWITAFCLKCSPILLLKKILPPFLVGFSTANSMTALPSVLETGEKKLGIRHNLVSFMSPLVTVMYGPATVLHYVVFACTFAEIYHVGIDLSWLVQAIVIAPLLTIATPPLPGSAILGYTLLFSSLGIPQDALVLAATLSMILDFPFTGFNVMLRIFQIACEARKLGGIDRDVLLS